MDAAIIGLVGVLIGGIISSITAFVTSVLNNQHQLRLEKEKAIIARRDTLDKEIRSQVAEVAREMLSAQHSME
jgi:gas vesicle protein